MPKLFSQKAKCSSCIYLNTWKYNVCSIKRDRKVMHLHIIWVKKSSLLFFLLLFLQIGMLSKTLDYYL